MSCSPQAVRGVCGILVAVGAMAFTVGSMLTMWVFAAAGLANMTDAAEVRRVGFWVLGFSLFCVAGLLAASFLLRRQHPGWSVAAALAPALVMGVNFAYLIFK